MFSHLSDQCQVGFVWVIHVYNVKLFSLQLDTFSRYLRQVLILHISLLSLQIPDFVSHSNRLVSWLLWHWLDEWKLKLCYLQSPWPIKNRKRLSITAWWMSASTQCSAYFQKQLAALHGNDWRFCTRFWHVWASTSSLNDMKILAGGKDIFYVFAYVVVVLGNYVQTSKRIIHIKPVWTS